jgi:hypothetical protein
MKNLMTPSEIEQATFQLVAQCLTQLPNRVLQFELHNMKSPIQIFQIIFNCCFTVHFDKFKAFFANKYTLY